MARWHILGRPVLKPCNIIDQKAWYISESDIKKQGRVDEKGSANIKDIVRKECNEKVTSDRYLGEEHSKQKEQTVKEGCEIGVYLKNSKEIGVAKAE